MKKYYLPLAILTLAAAVVSCDDDNKGIDYSKPRTWNVEVLNHVLNTSTGEALSPSLSKQQIVWTLSDDKGTFTFSPTLRVSIGGGEQTFSTGEIKAPNSEEHTSVYSFNNAALTDAKQFTGMINPMEQTLYWRYVTESGFRVISTPPLISTASGMVTKSDYGDTITNHVTPAYTIKIDPSHMTANVVILNYTHARKGITYTSITMNGVPFETTPNGYEIKLDKGAATAVYPVFNEKPKSETFNVKDLKITINLNDNIVDAGMTLFTTKGKILVISTGAIHV